MNDSTVKNLAITERKVQQKPGGCVGIFFQLIDWKRKLSKKKLFSKKLLPPGQFPFKSMFIQCNDTIQYYMNLA